MLDPLKFALLQNCPEIQHGVFSRHGGVSAGAFDSLNCSYDVGDQQQAVDENLERIKNFLQLDRLIWAHQVHGTTILTQPGAGDAFITTEKNCGLLIKHADCQAALIYDPIKKVIANVHAGWRGSVSNIYAKVVEELKNYGCNPSNLLVCISPSLGPDSAQFLNYKTELPESFWEHQPKPYYFDFWSIAESQLMQTGVLKSHIEIAKKDTFTDSAYYSFRREKITGRNASIIAINPL